MVNFANILEHVVTLASASEGRLCEDSARNQIKLITERKRKQAHERAKKHEARRTFPFPSAGATDNGTVRRGVSSVSVVP